MDDIQIEQIRFELTWRIRHEVMHPDLPFENIKIKNDKDGIHFGLYAKNQLTSVISLFEVNNIYQFRKFATINAAQGKGYGTKLLEYIIMYVKKRMVKNYGAMHAYLLFHFTINLALKKHLNTLPRMTLIL